MNLIDAISPSAATEGCGPLLRSAHDARVSLRQQVFEFVRAQGQVARADITHALSVSSGSTTTLTADLIAAGYLRELERQPSGSGRGRPKVTLEVVPEAALTIGVKLAFQRHTAVLTDFAGNLIASASLASPDTRRGLPQLVDETDRLVERLLTEGGKSRSEVRAIGIGLPGIVDHHTGHVAWSSLLEARDQKLTEAFSARFNMPVVLDNDANMLTLAELWFGQGRAMSDFAVITVETGVGMGLVLGNQLYRGAHGMGLELGHTKVQMDGALCQCGQRGCLEAYLADYALARDAPAALGHGFDRSCTDEEIIATLLEKAKAGHLGAQAIFRRAGRFLSLGLSNVVQLFDPALIIVSGERLEYTQLYASEILETMQALTLTEGRRPCQIAFNAWDDLVWARGASALALSVMTDQLIGGETRAA